MSLEVSSRHVRILRTGERGGPRLSFMASELLRWLSVLRVLPRACPQAMWLPGKKVGKSAKHSRVHKRLSTE